MTNRSYRRRASFARRVYRVYCAPTCDEILAVAFIVAAVAFSASVALLNLYAS